MLLSDSPVASDGVSGAPHRVPFQRTQLHVDRRLLLLVRHVAPCVSLSLARQHLSRLAGQDRSRRSLRCIRRHWLWCVGAAVCVSVCMSPYLFVCLSILLSMFACSA